MQNNHCEDTNDQCNKADHSKSINGFSKGNSFHVHSIHSGDDGWHRHYQCDGCQIFHHIIQSVIDFLIIAVCIFTMIKFFEKFKKKEVKKEEPVKTSEEILLLREIRDSLKKKK